MSTRRFRDVPTSNDFYSKPYVDELRKNIDESLPEQQGDYTGDDEIAAQCEALLSIFFENWEPIMKNPSLKERAELIIGYARQYVSDEVWPDEAQFYIENAFLNSTLFENVSFGGGDYNLVGYDSFDDEQGGGEGSLTYVQLMHQLLFFWGHSDLVNEEVKEIIGKYVVFFDIVTQNWDAIKEHGNLSAICAKAYEHANNFCNRASQGNAIWTNEEKHFINDVNFIAFQSAKIPSGAGGD